MDNRNKVFGGTPSEELPVRGAHGVEECRELGQGRAMFARVLLVGVILALAGCAGLAGLGGGQAGNVAVMAPGPDAAHPKPRPPGGAGTAPPPPANASTAEAFDTTSAAERQAASAVTAPDSGGERALGVTIATLGNPARPGFWLETPLANAAGPGRVVSVATGESVLVELIPIAGDAGAGSRVSLAALRLLGVGLTGLHELRVFVR